MAKDRLKELMTKELNNLIVDRNSYRQKSLQFEEAAKKADKQINRLQHFLSDYESQDITVPTETKEPPKRMIGIKDEIINLLKEAYPSSLSSLALKSKLQEGGFNINSFNSAASRHVAAGIIEHSKVDRLNYYTLKVTIGVAARA